MLPSTQVNVKMALQSGTIKEAEQETGARVIFDLIRAGVTHYDVDPLGRSILHTRGCRDFRRKIVLFGEPKDSTVNEGAHGAQ